MAHSYFEATRFLDGKKDKKFLSEAAANALLYYEENCDFCDQSHGYYLHYAAHEGDYRAGFSVLRADEMRAAVPEPVILVLTANPIERGVLHRYLADCFGEAWAVYMAGADAYQVIRVNRRTVVHVHAERTGDEYTRQAIDRAAEIFNIDYIFLLGICYGIDYNKQKIGTTIISDRVIGYRVNFRDEEGHETPYAPEEEFNERPQPAFARSVHTYTNYVQATVDPLAKDGNAPRVTARPGTFLSTNSLVSSRQVKDSLVTKFQRAGIKALGGEMEACGIFKSACFRERDFRKWMVIKSICDWGESKNSLCPWDENEGERIKDAIQAGAMMNTSAVFKLLLSSGIL